MNAIRWFARWIGSFRLDELKNFGLGGCRGFAGEGTGNWSVLWEKKKPCPPLANRVFWKNRFPENQRLQRRPVHPSCEFRIAFNFAGHALLAIPRAQYKARSVTPESAQTDHPDGASHRCGAN